MAVAASVIGGPSHIQPWRSFKEHTQTCKLQHLVRTRIDQQDIYRKLRVFCAASRLEMAAAAVLVLVLVVPTSLLWAGITYVTKSYVGQAVLVLDRVLSCRESE
jgi:ABC-type nickel/cobalt efflux system permease component RcnA